MSPIEISILILLGIVLSIILICIILYFCLDNNLDNKYKYLYTETDQGYDLIKLLSEMDKILDREQFLTNRSADLRKMIDERRKYFIITNDVANELNSLRSDYMDVVTEYEELMQQKNKCQKDIDILIYKLPKKYKDALNYNWRQFT